MDERIGKCRPARHPARHFLLRQQAAFERRRRRHVVEFLPNADKLRPAIAVVEQPRLAALVGLGPGRPRRHAELSACEGRVHLLVVLRGEPRHTLEPQEAPEGAWAPSGR